MTWMKTSIYFHRIQSFDMHVPWSFFFFFSPPQLFDIENLVKFSKKPKLVEFTLEKFPTPKKFQFFGLKNHWFRRIFIFMYSKIML
jgi:hypothetical protein